MKYGATSHNRTVTASPLRRLGVLSARSVATLAPTPPSPMFGRADLLRKPLCARPNVSYSWNVIRNASLNFVVNIGKIVDKRNL